MQCPGCSHENRPGAKFCEDCGAALPRACAQCGQVLRAGAKFCDECGASTGAVATPAAAPAARLERALGSYTPRHLAEKILQSKSAIEGERKHVTVLFADVKGSMELAGQLDPEVWHGILDRFFQILADGIHRFEGTINQYTGDGVMALFGAPIAHEDHAHRACYAALHLRDRLRDYADELRVDPGVNFSFRLGMNSGEVVVGRIGDDLRMDYTAQGHTVGLAQRMEQLAPADGIALSEFTQQVVTGFFRLRSLGPLQIKGVAAPVEVFILEDTGHHRTRLDTSRDRGLSRFVGRGNESDALQVALKSAIAGNGRVAAVVGEPGVGKSRLCAEFLEHCKAEGITVYEAHCPAHGRTIPYLPLLELLRNLFGVTDQDEADGARQKVAAALSMLDDSFVEDRDLVLDFLGVADPLSPPLQYAPEVRQRRLFTFMRRLLQLKTAAEPIVILIDDLHWIDPGSDLFVAHIVEAVATTRTMMLVNFRPEYTADWLRKSWVLQLPMGPLLPEALLELVRDWVGTHPSVADLPARISERCGGNPFFAEEIVLSLRDTGRLLGRRGAYELTTTVDEIEVPATIQALLAARIDRLGEAEKQVLYAAAVIGKDFPRPLLERVLEIARDDIDSALAALLVAELLNERSVYPVTEYAFKHPLTHEVALHTQLGSARRQRHAAVAQVITATAAGRIEECAGLLAHHWTEAGESMLAARCHVRAAHWVSSTDLEASRRHWTKARHLLIAQAASAERSQLLLEIYPELLNQFDLLGGSRADAHALFEEAVALAREAGDFRTQALLYAVNSNLAASQNDFEGMQDHARCAVELADRAGDRSCAIFARYFLGRAVVWQGDWEGGVCIYDQSIEIAGGDDAAALEVLRYRPYIECLAIRANALTVLGRVREAFEYVDKFPALSRLAGVGADLSSAAADRLWPCLIAGEVARARQYADEALQIAERYGGQRGVVYALMACGSASVLAQRWSEGNAFLDRAQQRILATGAGAEWSVPLDAFQALCLAGLGMPERSLALVRRSAEGPDSGLRPLVGFLRARALRMLEAWEELERELAGTAPRLQSVNGQGALTLLMLERACLARARGDAEGFRRDLAEVRERFARMGVTGWDDYLGTIAIPDA